MDDSHWIVKALLALLLMDIGSLNYVCDTCTEYTGSRGGPYPECWFLCCRITHVMSIAMIMEMAIFSGISAGAFLATTL